ncbi:YbaY family lipoprotein [Undibacterium sp.]|uniref:YbaY family lipoprotein n=1 Tax=Undibacterium sp. TaxID=1914977 RepID=UPI0025F5E544|nr:YbaY family lipoprotein [Undibacterium sp.]
MTVQHTQVRNVGSKQKNFCSLAFAVIGLACLLTVPVQAQAQTSPSSKAETSFVIVSGSAAYKQRIALPPDAVLTVRVEDVSRADAHAKLLAETSEVFGNRQVPIRFLLKVPSSAIDERFTYSLRATIKSGNDLLFTTTRSYPVLTRGAANQVDLMLDAVPPPLATSASNVAKPVSVPVPTPKRELVLPASFAGVLPCADCQGVAQTLSLRADGLYRLRRTYLGKDMASASELGRWSLDAGTRQVKLISPQSVTQMELLDDGNLRLLDQQGHSIKTSANLDLRRTVQLDPISETLRWRGEVSVLADVLSFRDCASGIAWPVATAAEYVQLEQAYRQSAKPLLIQFDGRLTLMPATESAPREQMLVERLDQAEPGMACVPKKNEIAKEMKMSEESKVGGKPAASLTETYWKLSELDGVKISMSATQKREVRITLNADGGRVSGFGGCNQFNGAYQQSASALRFSQMATTRMACAATFMELENQVLSMLAGVNMYRIEGDHLALFKDEQVLARFDAVYLH